MKTNYLVYDIESFHGLFTAWFMDLENPERKFYMDESNYQRVLTKLEQIKPNTVMIGYNSNGYDSIVMDFAIKNKNLPYEKLAKLCKRLTDDIIASDDASWTIRRRHSVSRFINDYDLYTIGSGSLKEWGIKLHHEVLETLPFPVDKSIWTEEEKEIIKMYCLNDVIITRKLLKEVKWSAFQSKKDMIDSYNLPLSNYSKTDASIVEDMLADKTIAPIKTPFRYKPPFELDFDDQGLMDMYDIFTKFIFSRDKDTAPVKQTINSYGLELAFGVGGLHGCKRQAAHGKLIDLDVTSYYPNMMKQFGFMPRTLRDKQRYFDMIDERVKMKKINPSLANAMKVVINTVFGVQNKKNSPLYDLQMLYHITITGQLLIAKLHEELSLAGYEVVYVNTDGLSFVDNGTEHYKEVQKKWEHDTGLNLEESRFDKAWLKDVSNYIMVKPDGKLKTKGVYDHSIGSKNHAYGRVCYEASMAKLIHGTEIEDFIKDYKDPTGFIFYHKFSRPFVKTAVYGLKHDNVIDKFDKVVRYVLSSPSKQNYIKGYNTKQDSWMRKPDADNITMIRNFSEVMDNIDIDRYVEKAYEIYSDLTAEVVEHNPKMEKGVRHVQASMGLDIDSMFAANAKINLPNVHVLSPKTKTIKVKTGSHVDVLVLDVDDPKSHLNKRLLKMITKDDLIVHSTQYTLDDVFAGLCRYKVAFKYHGRDIPKKKLNNEIEVFYRHSLSVAMYGLRHDGYEYTMSGQIKDISFDINDVLQVAVPFKLFPDDKELALINSRQDKAKTVQKATNTKIKAKTDDSLKGDLVDHDEFLNHLEDHVERLPDKVSVSGNHKVLSFKCLFPEHHSSMKGANAYAFKKDGTYICKCQGEVCQHEYRILNNKLIAESQKLSNLPVHPGFSQDEGINLVLRPTGWGKTEAIAEEIVNHLREDPDYTLVVLLQSKEAIYRLLNRVDTKMDNITNTKILIQTKKIVKLISEDLGDDWEDDVIQSKVVVSHQEYFKHAGDVLTAFPQCDYITNNMNYKLIIDEAHAYLEDSTRVDMRVGGLYTQEVHYNEQSGTELVTYVQNSNSHKKTREQLIQDGMVSKTKCIMPYLDEYGQMRLNTEYKMIEGIEYLDVFKHVTEAFKPVNKPWVEEHEKYMVFANPNPKPIVYNRTATSGRALSKLFDSSQYVLFCVNMGSKDIGRRNVGHIDMSVYSNQLLTDVLKKAKSVILTTATFSKHHYDILNESIGIHGYDVDEENAKINKIGKIAVLKSNRYARVKDKIMDSLMDWKSTKALMFFPTIKKAHGEMLTYPHTLLNNNGTYSFGARNGYNDTGDNLDRNVVVCALEGSPAKGYNHVEEIDQLSNGFKLIFFDRSPVSPKRTRKYVVGGKVIDANEDYILSSFIQAIGRAMRKKKDTLTLAFNNVEEKHMKMIKKYLRDFTTSDIIEEELTMTNIKIAVGLDNTDPRYLEQLSNNKFYQKLLGSREDD